MLNAAGTTVLKHYVCMMRANVYAYREFEKNFLRVVVFGIGADYMQCIWTRPPYLVMSHQKR